MRYHLFRLILKFPTKLIRKISHPHRQQTTNHCDSIDQSEFKSQLLVVIVSGEISWVCEGVCMIDCLRAVNRDTGLNFGIIVGIRPDFPSLDTSSWWRGGVFPEKLTREKPHKYVWHMCVCVCVFLVFVRAVIMELFLVVSTFFGAMQYFTQNRICYCVCVCVSGLPAL